MTEILGFIMAGLASTIVILYLLLKVKNDEIDRLKDEVISLNSKIKSMREAYEAQHKMEKIAHEPPKDVPDTGSYNLGIWD